MGVRRGKKAYCPLFPLPPSGIAPWGDRRLFDEFHTKFLGFHQANIGLPPLLLSALVASVVVAPSSVSIVVPLFLGIDLPNAHLPRMRSTSSMLRILLSFAVHVGDER